MSCSTNSKVESSNNTDKNSVVAVKTDEHTTATTIIQHDPLLRNRPSTIVEDGTHVLLHFTDGRRIFAHCLLNRKNQKPPLKINRKTFSTHNLVGLPYGSVLEQELNYLKPLPHGAKLMPEFPTTTVLSKNIDDENNDDNNDNISVTDTDNNDGCIDNNNNNDDNNNNNRPAVGGPPGGGDNRSFIDNNTAQILDHQEIRKMRATGTAGEQIVANLIENSITFDQKTEYSQFKYIQKKQLKHQPRCRIVRCNGPNICEAMYIRDPKKVMNLREDTLGQILSYANISAGCQTLVMENCMGIVTGSIAQRLSGYGRILSIFTGQQHPFNDMLSKFNLTFAERNTIKWIHSGDVFVDRENNNNNNNNNTKTTTTTNGDGDADNNNNNNNQNGTARTQQQGEQQQKEEEEDIEKLDRDGLEWPCMLQPHTRKYLDYEINDDEKKRDEFLLKRAARFGRKLCRITPTESVKLLHERLCDSIILVTRYDPTETIIQLLQYLAPSCPFVIFCEFIEPLTECFKVIQTKNVAINLRLSHCWMREYQVLPNRTHPNMTMSQSGGYILTGIKLDPITGINDIDENLLNEIRSKLPGRRGKRKNNNNNKADENNNDNKGKTKKRRRTEKESA